MAAMGAVLVGFVVSLTAWPAIDPDPASAAKRRSFSVSPTMTMNDPTHKPGTISRQLRSYINNTPRGATISIMSFYISSSITWPALRKAYQRGVNIRAVLYGGPQGKPLTPLSWEGAKLTELINQGKAKGRKGSWVVWTKNTARGKDSPETVMHAKAWQFSQVGKTKKVTMIGSYNNGDGPDGRAYSAMVTLTDPKLYREVQSVFRASAKDRYLGKNPQKRASGNGWDAYFFPSTPITKKNDPVMKRLLAIPGNSDTQMTVSMYSWQGRRGAWIAGRLATMVKKGAQLTVVVGPDVAPSVVKTLRKAGTKLEDGCWRTGRKKFPYAYTHDKEMTATWVKNGERHYAAWLGSDDWGNGPGGSLSDQITIGLYSEWAYNRLNQLLAPQIAHKPDRFEHCDPI